jgi:LPPG:FO 2-phospho-L-lactate transferase
MRIAALAGGVGAAKFLAGLVQEISPEDLTVVVNTGDDFEWHGLTVCPDLDTVIYTLGGIANPSTGWGVRGDTFNALERLDELGSDSWFRIGDRDLATHVYRTHRLRCGSSLSDVARALAAASGVTASVLPMSDAPVRTRVHTDEGTLDFQDYFVRRRTEGHTREIIFDGAETSRPAPGILEAILEARAVIFSPSNPLVSIGPVLSVPGVREALKETPAKVAAVSPIVGGKALKGPADRMLRDQGMEPSAVAVAQLYVDFLDLLVIDNVDAKLKPEIESLGVDVLVTDTIMDSMEKKAALGRAVLNAVTA